MCLHTDGSTPAMTNQYAKWAVVNKERKVEGGRLTSILLMTFCSEILFNSIKLVFRRFGRRNGLAATSTRGAGGGELQRTLEVQQTLCKFNRVQVYNSTSYPHFSIIITNG